MDMDEAYRCAKWQSHLRPGFLNSIDLGGNSCYVAQICYTPVNEKQNLVMWTERPLRSKVWLPWGRSTIHVSNEAFSDQFLSLDDFLSFLIDHQVEKACIYYKSPWLSRYEILARCYQNQWEKIESGERKVSINVQGIVDRMVRFYGARS